ncbi:MAG TPA: NTP-binding protein, partial [Marinobacter adhaerens]|nr:NTP-binding protein [Marinobacter adhaerens]
MTTGSPVVQLLDGVLVVTGEVNTDTVVGLRKQGEKLIRLASAD